MHDRLSRSVELFNRCFASQLLFLTCSGFGFTLFSTFGVIHSSATNAPEDDRRIAMVNIGYDGLLMITIVTFVVFSSLVNDEVCICLNFWCHALDIIVTGKGNRCDDPQGDCVRIVR